MGVEVKATEAAARPLVRACLEGLSELPVELLTPAEEDALAGIIAFKHPAFEEINRRLRAQNIHVMAQAGRMRVAIHGHNMMDKVTTRAAPER